MKPLNKVKIKWSSDFAYAIGLLVTDGSLSIDKRHLELTSKDVEQLNNFNKCLQTNFKIFLKDKNNNNKCFRVQFSDVSFYNFLITIGLMPKKTKIIDSIKIPKKYFFDFLRGHFDGDGCFYSYWDRRWKHSFMFYTTFLSASKKHINWLRGEISKRIGIKGHITKAATDSVYQLRYAKKESIIILKKMYYKNKVTCLSRKRLKINKVLDTIEEIL
ncbi:MAG TPA: hypothetical protein PK367_03305 [Candidatus Paceibacterota bacterium]|nr:hypothetical protein [Candidatus Paceibacterota bacterium]